METNDFRHVYDVEKIFEVVLAFNGLSDRTTLLETILTKMMEITYSDAGTLYIVEEGKLHFRIIRNKTLGIYQSAATDEINLPPIVLDSSNIQNVSAYCAITNEVVQVDDVYGEIELFNMAGPKNYDKMTGYYTRAMLVLPLCTQRGSNDEVLGVIQLMNPLDPVTGGPGVYGNIDDPPIVPALARIAANTLSNLTYVKELRNFMFAFAGAMTQAIDERTPYNNHHTQNVARYCREFAGYLGEKFPAGHPLHFDKHRTERLTLAALLHDIGKISTPLSLMHKANRLGSSGIDAVRYRFQLKKHQIKIEWLSKRISDDEYAAEMKAMDEALEFVEFVDNVGFLQDDALEKVQSLGSITYVNTSGDVVPLLDADDLDALSIRKGTLTVAERESMQKHVVITGRLLDEIPYWKYYEDVPLWARSHHEFLDGTGYPSGLSGDAIPIEACIITITDIYDALVASDRPYKKAMPVDKSLQILVEMANEGKLHKELVELFIESKTWEDELR